MLDRYAFNYPVSSLSTVIPTILNSPMGDYGEAASISEMPNGAWSQFYFCDSLGVPLTSAAGNTSPFGLPLSLASPGTVLTQNFYIRWQTAEHLLLPPFIFGDDFELSTGLFGVQNFQVQMNMASTPSRAIRIANNYVGRTIGTTTITGFSVAWGDGATVPVGYAFQPTLSVQFLTPALDVPLPPKSIVPYMEFPRYITSVSSAIGSTLGSSKSALGRSTGAATIQSNTITLPNIPDLLMVYLKPNTPNQTSVFTTTAYSSAQTGGTTVQTVTAFDSTICDFVLPIESVSINFDNFSGLLSNMTQYQLYKMSYNNGVNMDYNTWSGESRGRPTNAASLLIANSTGTPYLSLAGGPLVLRPGRDFALQAGQAPGLVGNFSLQLTLTVGCQFVNGIAANGVSLYVVPISSGFFETIKGSSRIIKGVLTEQDILGSSPGAPQPDHIERPVGAGMRGSLGKAAVRHAMSQYRRD